MTWQFNRTNLACGMIALLGIAQFVYFVILAFGAYAGGYSLTENFLSDLGRTVTDGGLNNSAAAAFFNRSVILLGCSLIPFFAVMPEVLESGRWLVRVAGVLSAIGLIGLGLTPYDVHLAAHLVALGLWIIPMLVAVVGFFVGADLSGRARAVLFIGTISVVLAGAAYAFVDSHSEHVVYQKILVVLAAIWFCLVLACVSVSAIQSLTPRRLLVEKQARQYLKVIQRRYRRDR